MHGHELVQDGGQLMQAVQVLPGQLLHDLLAVRGQADAHHPAVSASGVRSTSPAASARSTSSTALCGRSSR